MFCQNILYGQKLAFKHSVQKELMHLLSKLKSWETGHYRFMNELLLKNHLGKLSCEKWGFLMRHGVWRIEDGKNQYCQSSFLCYFYGAAFSFLCLDSSSNFLKKKLVCDQKHLPDFIMDFRSLTKGTRNLGFYLFFYRTVEVVATAFSNTISLRDWDKHGVVNNRFLLCVPQNYIPQIKDQTSDWKNFKGQKPLLAFGKEKAQSYEL